MQKFTLSCLLMAMLNIVAMRAQTGLNLPYSQYFDAETILETGWKTQVYGAGAQDHWEISKSANAGGDAGEVSHSIQYVSNSKTMLVSPALNTSGVSELKLSFNYYLNGKNSGSKAKLIIQSSTDGIAWTDETWGVDVENPNRVSGPYTVKTVIKGNTNSTHTYIAFAIVGSFTAITNWSIDNVYISALSACNAPSEQASELTFSDVSTNSVKASWTRGNGAGVLVVARKGFPVESSPLSSMVYAPDGKMGAGDCIGDESFVVYRGSETSVTVTNLDQYSDYYFALYEYTIDPCYNTTPLQGKVFTALPGTKVWKGLSEDWFDELNWTGASIPGPTHNVVLPAGCNYYPRLVGTTTVKTLRITEGARLLLDKTPNLTVSDSMMIHGTFEMLYGVATINAVYSYPNSLTYIRGGAFTASKWAGGPVNDYGYGLVHVYGGKLNVSGNMRFAYTSNHSSGLNMGGSSSELNIGGSLDFSTNSSFSDGTINLLGTSGAGPFEFAQQSGGISLPTAFHLNVNAPSKTYEFNNGYTGMLNIYGNLNIIAGTVKLTKGTTYTSLNVSGNISIGSSGMLNCGNTNAGITLKGNWDNFSPATFIHSNNTVLFNGKSNKISGSTTFYGLTINPGDNPSVVTFASGSASKVTVTGPLTMSSSAMGKLSLRSDVPGTQWEIDPQGTRTISNVDVRDSKNVNATAIDATSGSNISTGNNTKWTFGTTASTYISATGISNFGSVVANSFSPEASFDFSGANLTTDITITVPAGFQISKTTGSGFTSSLTYSPVSGGVPYQKVYVRMNPSAAGALTGNISLATTGVTTKTISVSGTGTAAVPIIILNPSTVSNNFGIVPVYSSSTEFSYSVYGSNLTADLTVTVTGEFEITKTSGSDYGKTLTFAQTDGYASGTVYCRYSPKGYFSSGVITHTSTGATNKTASVSGNGIYQGTLITSKTTIADFGDIVVGESSAVDSFTVQGSGLYNYIVLRANDGFKLSTKKNGSFTSSLTLYTVIGSLSETKVYVKFAPVMRGEKQGLVEISSSNSMYRYITLNGTGACSATPKIISSNNSVSFSSAPLNTYSEVKPFVWGGCSLTDAVNLTASSGFEISVYPDKGFTSSINFSPVSGIISDTTVYIRTKPLITNDYSGDLTIKTSGTDDKLISLNGTGFYVGPPMLFVNPAGISFETTDVDAFSGVQGYTLNGSCLNGDVTITAPEGFLISTADSPLSSYGSTLTLSNGGSVYATPIFVVFNPKTKKAYNSSITLSSAGASDKLVNVSGICAHSVVTLSTNTIESFGDVKINTASAEKSFTVSGTELTYDVVITASENFEVSATSGSGYSETLTLTASAGTLKNTTVYVRFKPLEITEYSGEISVDCGSINETLQLSGSGSITGSTRVKSIKNEEAFIYPNPADRVLYIKHEMLIGKSTIGIYDLEGRCLITKQVEEERTLSIDISPLPSGTYLVKLTNGQTVSINKLMKK